MTDTAGTHRDHPVTAALTTIAGAHDEVTETVWWTLDDTATLDLLALSTQLESRPDEPPCSPRRKPPIGGSGAYDHTRPLSGTTRASLA